MTLSAWVSVERPPDRELGHAPGWVAGLEADAQPSDSHLRLSLNAVQAGTSQTLFLKDKGEIPCSQWH